MKSCFSPTVAKIYTVENGQYKDLPDWCSFFIRCGSVLGQFSDESWAMMVVCVPTRAFAAVLSGVGIISKLMMKANQKSKQIKLLEDLKLGTPVFVYEKDKKIKGFFNGIKDLGDGKQRIGVQVSMSKPRKFGPLVNYYPIENATNIVPIEKISASISNKTLAPRSYDLIRNKGFIKGVLTDDLLWELATVSQTEFLIVGNARLLASELKENDFAINNGNFYSKGVLQDIIRTKRFSGQNDTFRSDIIPSDRSTFPDIADNYQPRIVVFDGSMGFLKSRTIWRKAHWLVILDRTEPLFDEAVSLANELYMQRKEDWNPMSPDDIPPSVEIVSWLLNK